MEQFDFRNFTDQDLAELSKDELLQMRGLLMKRKKFNQDLVNESEMERLSQETKEDVTTSNLEAAAHATLAGASYGASDEILATVNAVKESIPAAIDAFDKQTMAGVDNVFSTYKQSYSKNHRDYNKHLKQLEQEHPGTYNAARFGGALATGIGIGGLVSKAGFGIAGQLATMSGEGFFAGAMSSNADTFGGRLQAGAPEAGFAVAAGGAGVAGAKLVKASVTKLNNSSFINFLSDSLKDFKGNVTDDVTEFSTRMIDYTDDAGAPVLNWTQNAEGALESITKNSYEVNKSLDTIYTEIDDLNIIKLDSMYLKDRLGHEVIDNIAPFGKNQVGSSARRHLQKRVSKRIEKDFTMSNPQEHEYRKAMLSKGMTPAQIVEIEKEMGAISRVPKELNISLLNNIKKDYFREVDKLRGAKGSTSGATTFADELEKVAFSLTEIIDEHIGSVSNKLGKGAAKKVDDASGQVVEEIEESLYDMWRSKSTQYHDLLRSKSLLQDKVKSSEGKSLFRKMFVDSAGKLTMAGGVAMAMFGVPYAPAVVVGGAMRAIAETPRLTKGASLGLNKIVTAMNKNPDAYRDAAGRLLVAADISSNALYDRVLELGAEVDLKEQQIQRDTKDVIARQDSIRTMIEMKSPEYLDKFEEAITNNDSAGIGAVVSSIPGLKEFISPGLGWEGKAVSKQDQAAVMDFMRKNMKPKQRRASMLKFANDLMIPQDMFTGQDAKKPENQVIYKKRTDKLNKGY